MNHQMIVVKPQPLWMILLRGSTGVYSDTGTAWVGDPCQGLCAQEVPIPVPAGQEQGLEGCTKRR